MSLERLLDRMERHVKRRFITTQERYRGTRELTEGLETPSDHNSLRRLDELALELKRQSYKREDRDLEEAIARIDQARRPYRTTGPAIAYEILRTPRIAYTDRFREVERYIQSHDVTYDDLRLVKHHLENDSYLRRKERALQDNKRDDDPYFSAKHALMRRIDAALIAHGISAREALTSKPRMSWAYKGVAAATGALLVLASVPATLYATLL